VSSRDSVAAGNRPNHPATALSSRPGKIQRTSRLRTASVTALSGGSAVIVHMFLTLADGQLRALPPHDLATSYLRAG
jgi:hypothetical protein